MPGYHVGSYFRIKNAVDPIGAGDAFDAGFLAGILENKPLAECGKLANAWEILPLLPMEISKICRQGMNWISF